MIYTRGVFSLQAYCRLWVFVPILFSEEKGRSMGVEERMTRVIEAARVSGQSVDLLWALGSGLSASALARLCGNAESLPRKTQSRDTE